MVAIKKTPSPLIFFSSLSRLELYRFLHGLCLDFPHIAMVLSTYTRFPFLVVSPYFYGSPYNRGYSIFMAFPCLPISILKDQFALLLV